MVTVSVIPERFDSGDFAAWIRHFDCCSNGNGWTDDEKLREWPAFLKGQTASYFSHCLPRAETRTLTLSRICVNCCVLLFQRNNAMNQNRLLRPSKDPSLCYGTCRNCLPRPIPVLQGTLKTPSFADNLCKIRQMTSVCACWNSSQRPLWRPCEISCNDMVPFMGKSGMPLDPPRLRLRTAY